MTVKEAGALQSGGHTVRLSHNPSLWQRAVLAGSRKHTLAAGPTGGLTRRTATLMRWWPPRPAAGRLGPGPSPGR